MLCTVNSSLFNSAEASIRIPIHSLEIWCGWERLSYKASSALLSPNDFTKASSFYLCLYFSCFSSLWHHWHTLLASLPYTFFLLSFLDNAFLHSSHNCCFIVLIYLGKNKALSMPGRNMSSDNAKATYRKSWIIFCYLQVYQMKVCRTGHCDFSCVSESLRSLAREAAFAVWVPLAFPAFSSWRKEKHNTDWKNFWRDQDGKIWDWKRLLMHWLAGRLSSGVQLVLNKILACLMLGRCSVILLNQSPHGNTIIRINMYSSAMCFLNEVWIEE